MTYTSESINFIDHDMDENNRDRNVIECAYNNLHWKHTKDPELNLLQFIDFEQ